MDLAEMKLPVFLPGNQRNWDEVQGTARITEEGEIIVKLGERADAAHLVEMAKNGVLMQVAFDYKMPAEIKEQLTSPKED